MLIRMFEYDAQIALSHREIHNGVLDVFFPESGVLYVRERGKTPEKLKVRIHTSGTDAEYEVRTLKVKDYTEDDLFQKRLYLVMPFWLCRYEEMIPGADKDAELRNHLEDKLSKLLERLNEENDAGRISDYAYATITRVFRNLADYLTRKYKKIGEEIERIMGGKIIDYPERRIYNAGVANGEERGGFIEICSSVADGDMPLKTAVKRAKKLYGVTNEADFKKRAKVLGYDI